MRRFSARSTQTIIIIMINIIINILFGSEFIRNKKRCRTRRRVTVKIFTFLNQNVTKKKSVSGFYQQLLKKIKFLQILTVIFFHRFLQLSFSSNL